MALQVLIVTVVVASSVAYTAWTLMPQALRRVLARNLQRLALPRPLAAYLDKAARTSTGCDCSGCDAAPAKGGKGDKTAIAAEQPVRFHPRKPH